MDKELAYIYIIPMTCLLWMLGGKYNKAIRRLGIPVLVFLPILILMKVAVFPSVMTVILTIIAYHLPYGENCFHRERAVTALCFSASTVFLGVTWWQLVPPAAFLITYYGSNYKPTAFLLPWKLCEAITGMSIGITVSFLIVSWKT